MRTRHVRRGIRTTVVLAAVAVAATACTSDPGAPASSGGQAFLGLRGAAPVALQADRGCGEVLEDFQAFAPAVLSDQMFGFGGTDMALGGTEEMVEADVSSSAGGEARAAEPSPAAAPDDGGGSSETNTQEAGIDEPDVVENDGAFVYVVDHGPDQAHLVILDAGSADVLSRTPLAAYDAQLLLQGDRMLVVTSGGGIEPASMPVEDGPATMPVPFPAGTVLQLLDVADRRAPRLLQRTEVEGQHVSTRVVGGIARVVVTSYPDVQPMFEDMSRRLDGDGGRDAAEESLASSVAATTIDDWLPAFRTTVVDDGPLDSRTSTEGSLVACEDVLVPEVNAGIAQTSVLRVDFTDGFDPAETTTVVAEAGTVYASASTLYVAANAFVPLEDQGRVVGEDFTTALHAFDLRGDGAAGHLGAGQVPGHLLNQYSLSEHDGHLRIATTEGAPWGGGEPSQSGVRVLQLDGDRLVEVGAVTGLGLTETIQSVRFMGDVGYVVTFRQTDPLYVVDLSDPTSPQAVGELKIPGFSSYLHPVADGRLVGIGRDADLQGQDQGLLVSLFDVSDPTAPTQVQTWTERDAWSMAGHDPKAFLHWAPESAVIVPMERVADGNARSGMVVLDIADGGITERAMVTAEGRYPSRALVVQGRLWSLFDGGVVVSDFADPSAGTFSPFR